MKRIISFILAVMTFLGLSVTASAAGGTVFTDVKGGSWYEPAVFTVSSIGIMEGKGDGKFAPNASMTRAELVTVLYRLSKEIIFGDGELSFKDVKNSAWYAEAITWAVNAGLVSGYPEGTFKPNAPILRQELAKMFVSFLEYMSITKKGAPLTDSFTDSARFPSWAAEYIEKLRETGLMGGDENGRFKPKANASRAEIATVITRLLPLMEEEESTNNGGADTEYVPAPAPKDFELCTEDGAPFPYYIRFPEGYSESTKYPLVIFTAGDDAAGIAGVGAIFPDADSPAYDSIVMIPAVGIAEDLEFCGELFTYVADKYSVDTERVYLIGTASNGCFFTFKTLEQYPMCISAALFIHGAVEAYFGEGETLTLEGTYWNTIPEELKDLPIYYIHCTDDYNPIYDYNIGPEYGDDFKGAADNDGFTSFKLSVVEGYLQIYENFASREDLGAFDWLFEQRRETK